MGCKCFYVKIIRLDSGHIDYFFYAQSIVIKLNTYEKKKKQNLSLLLTAIIRKSRAF